VSQGPGVIVESSVLDDGKPIRAISFVEPEQEWDSGYGIWASEPDRIGNTELLHFGCLLEHFPDVAPTLRYAREHGEWVDGPTV
jgi:hypothetical protein